MKKYITYTCTEPNPLYMSDLLKRGMSVKEIAQDFKCTVEYITDYIHNSYLRPNIGGKNGKSKIR